MTYIVKPTSGFQKDLKRIQKRGYDIALLTEIIKKLANGEQLPEKNHDHNFYYSGDGKEYRKLPPTINLVSQNTNAFGGFLSLRPGIFAWGSGEAVFREFTYTGLS